MDMSNFANALPLAPLHWTSILHYLMLLGALVVLFGSGDKAPVLFIIIILILALMIAASLYLNLLRLPDRIFAFLIRIFVMAIPLVIAGMGPNEQTRGFGIALTIPGLVLLGVTIASCLLGPLGDPRLAYWCRLPLS